MKNFSIIAAIDINMGITRNGKLPWYLPEDIKYFHRITKAVDHSNHQNALIMDQSAWDSLPDHAKPLGDRINVVLSTDEELDLPDGVLQFENLEAALMALSTSEIIEEVFVMGGESLFAEAILYPNLERIYLTKIEADFDCDAFFPDQIPDLFEVISATEILEDEGIEYVFVVLERTPVEELEDDENEAVPAEDDEENPSPEITGININQIF